MFSAKGCVGAAAAVLLLSSGMVTPVHALNSEQLVVNICTAVAANDKTRLRQKLRSASVRLRDIYEGIRCNGDTLLRFAIKSNASDAGSFVAGRLPVNKLKAPEFDGKTVLQWADANGKKGSDIVAAINHRIN